MYRTQIQLRENQARTLRELAAERNQSMAELIRQAVDELLRSEAGVSPEERRRRAIEAAGSHHSGSSDTAAEHDRYLGQAFADDDLR